MLLHPFTSFLFIVKSKLSLEKDQDQELKMMNSHQLEMMNNVHPPPAEAQHSASSLIKFFNQLGVHWTILLFLFTDIQIIWFVLLFNTRAGLSYLERYIKQITLEDDRLFTGRQNGTIALYI